MGNIAIVVGNANYIKQSNLPCCAADVAAMEELLQSTRRYSVLRSVIDLDATSLKAQIRDAIAGEDSVEELFFYFSGHGYHLDGEFYHCASNFDARRPNETGVSTSELHELIRPINPKLLVKVIDACNSGTPLIKDGVRLFPLPKIGITNVFQFASCLENQLSLTGNPLSEFTQKFLAAAVRKATGPVYYMDIASILRDEFIEDESQTPHFISQGSGRDIFVEDPQQLEEFRASLATKWAPETNSDIASVDRSDAESNSAEVSERSSALLQILESAEKEIANAELVEKFVADLFDRIFASAKSEEFADFFVFSTIEHSDYQENNTHDFIFRCLRKEARPDKFVTTEVVRKKRLLSSYDRLMRSVGYYAEDDQNEIWRIDLNYKMDRAQIKRMRRPRPIDFSVDLRAVK